MRIDDRMLTADDTRGALGIIVSIAFSFPFWLVMLLLMGGGSFRRSTVYIFLLFSVAILTWAVRCIARQFFLLRSL